MVGIAKYFWEKVHTGQIKYLYCWYCQVFLEKYTPVKYKFCMAVIAKYFWKSKHWSNISIV